MTRLTLGRAVEGGTLLPPFTDAHVHLGLVDATALLPHGIAVVHDLGWVPDVAASWVGTPGLPAVELAGAFLTAPRGYPSDRSWAPDGSVVEIASPEEAVAAVDRQLAAGASFVKVALNSVAGPVPDDGVLAAIVGRAHERGRSVVAHTEGAGQAARAFECGVDRLAHAPFSERLPDALLVAMTARPSRPGHAPSGMTWVSTLDVHGYGTPTPQQDVAIDNVRRFSDAGGTVVYGTDLGNGPLPVGVNERELRALAAAGLGPDALLRSLTSASTPPAEHDLKDASSRGTTARSFSAGRMTFVPGEPPDDPSDLPRWLAGATTVPRTEKDQT
ncbi:amidohydrolase [Cellulosimicrobium terreum]|nr:amidohydrolase [Cellulosimicrobium terreum]